MVADPPPRRGEVWWIALDPTRGSEIRKTRPAVVVSLPGFGRPRMRIVVPLTEWDEGLHPAWPWMVRVEPGAESGLSMRSAADCSQVRAVDVDRLRGRLGELSAHSMDLIAAALAGGIGLPP